MIIWVNGPFGGGKTVTAFELHRRLPGSFVFDPEETGFFLRRVQPVQLLKDDFQDEPLWCPFNLRLLEHIAREHPGPVIVPMTVIRPEYYHAIITRLREQGIRVDHYTLLAEAATIRRRLALGRLAGPQSWAARQVTACLKAFRNPLFEGRIKTDNLPVPVVAQAIARRSGLDIRPADRRLGRFWARNMAVRLGHIR